MSITYDIPEIVVEVEYTAFSAHLFLLFALHDEERTEEEVTMTAGGSESTFSNVFHHNHRVVEKVELLAMADCMYEFEPIGAMQVRLAKSLLARLPARLDPSVVHEIVTKTVQGWTQHRISLFLTDLVDFNTYFQVFIDMKEGEVVSVKDCMLTRSSRFALALGR
jgi:hypothetical protein